jgi:alanine-glyoxylate transaminase/serine-glyoxylate transaminase/serine-pyruvate transaminase
MEYYPAPGRNHLFVPGPTNVPEPILRAMNRSNEDHRSPAFPKLSASVIEDVKQIFRTTTATSFIFPTTGTNWRRLLLLFWGELFITLRLAQQQSSRRFQKQFSCSSWKLAGR